MKKNNLVNSGGNDRLHSSLTGVRDRAIGANVDSARGFGRAQHVAAQPARKADSRAGLKTGLSRIFKAERNRVGP